MHSVNFWAFGLLDPDDEDDVAGRVSSDDEVDGAFLFIFLKIKLKLILCIKQKWKRSSTEYFRLINYFYY